MEDLHAIRRGVRTELRSAVFFDGWAQGNSGGLCEVCGDMSLPGSSWVSKIVKMSALLSMAILFGGFFLLHSVFTSFAQESDVQLASLMDELGSLNQENFSLEQRVDSQEAVLKFLAEDLSLLQRTLEVTGGDYSVFEEIFSELSAEQLSLEDVELSSIPEDETLDILILGSNGAHTDTIMVASVNDAEGKVNLVSIPRDLYINGRRINQYYYYYGIDQMERMVESVTGLSIDKYVQVDMNAFEEVVDAIGGIDVYVDEAIYDGYYPNGKGGYAAYSIDVGHYHMNGEEALKYARSRKSTSDFARAERQQEIVSAVRTKMLQMDTIMDMKALTSLFRIVMDSVNTDVELFDAVSYYYDYGDYDVQTGLVLSSSNYLYSIINESGAYILLPNTGNFEEIHEVIQGVVK